MGGNSVNFEDGRNFEKNTDFVDAKVKEGVEVKCYSLVWPILAVKEGDNAYRDFLMGFDESKQRSARLAVWFGVPESYF